MIVMKWTIDTAKLDAMAKNLNVKADDVVNSLAHDVEKEAKIFTTPNVKTGTLKGSIHVKPMGNLLYWVADATDYGIYLELGHYTRARKQTVEYEGVTYSLHNFVRAYPFMVPAVEKVRRTVAEKFAELFK